MKKFRFPLRSVATVRGMIELRAREQFSRAVQACVAAEKKLTTQRERVAELESILRSGRLSHFRPADQEAEVTRLLALGARHADVGQTGDEPWVVLQDPEGNEFCVLAPRRN